MAPVDEVVYESTRLRLRPLRLSDIEEVAAMVADPEQMRFYGQPKSKSEADDWLSWNLALYDRYGFGTWCMELGDGRFLGYCGIRPLQLDEPEVELAWHVKKGMWGQGLGTEAAQAALRLGLNRFGLPSLVAMIHPENAPSLRIAKRLGMARERQLMHFGQPTILYRTSRQPLHTPIA